MTSTSHRSIDGQCQRRVTVFACALALSGCAAGFGTIPSLGSPPHASTPGPAPAPVELDVTIEDTTRNERWLATFLPEELAKRGVKATLVEAGTPGRGSTLLHVRVLARESDHGLVGATGNHAGEQTRLDRSTDVDSDAFRTPPKPETPIYARRPESSPAGNIDDFGLRTIATIQDRGSSKPAAESIFEERAIGLSPVPSAQRSHEWEIVYRGVAARIAAWARQPRSTSP